MYKCYECDKVFESPMTYTEDSGEKMAACPRCGGAYMAVEKCSGCGEYFFPDMLYNGHWCDKCLLDRVTYKSFLDFMESGNRNILPDFMFAYVWKLNGDHALKGDKSEMLKDLRAVYKARANMEQRGSAWSGRKNTDFIDACKKAVYVDWMEDFAEWIDKEKSV